MYLKIKRSKKKMPAYMPITIMMNKFMTKTKTMSTVMIIKTSTFITILSKIANVIGTETMTTIVNLKNAQY